MCHVKDCVAKLWYFLKKTGNKVLLSLVEHSRTKNWRKQLKHKRTRTITTLCVYIQEINNIPSSTFIASSSTNSNQTKSNLMAICFCMSISSIVVWVQSFLSNLIYKEEHLHTSPVSICSFLFNFKRRYQWQHVSFTQQINNCKEIDSYIEWK